MRKIILASASPRRKKILEKTGLNFSITTSNYEEDLDLPLKPRELARFLSRKKAEAVMNRYKNAIIIAADTFIVFRGRPFGKPHSPLEARKMLSLLNGRSHTVITGYTVINTGTGEKITRSVETRVWIKKMTVEEIDAYVASREPLDKAGAYAIQGQGAMIVKRIDGDYLNVVGLPLFDIVQTLKKLGIRVLLQRLRV